MAEVEFQKYPPVSDKLTSYDERHLVTYLRLLDADAEGVTWQEAAKIVFGTELAADGIASKTMFDRHLARAKWMSEAGFAHLLSNQDTSVTK